MSHSSNFRYLTVNVLSTSVLNILCIILRHNIHPYFDRSTTLVQHSVRIQVFRRGIVLTGSTKCIRLSLRACFFHNRTQKDLIIKTLFYNSNILHKQSRITFHVNTFREYLHAFFSRVPFASFYLRS